MSQVRPRENHGTTRIGQASWVGDAPDHCCTANALLAVPRSRGMRTDGNQSAQATRALGLAITDHFARRRVNVVCAVPHLRESLSLQQHGRAFLDTLNRDMRSGVREPSSEHETSASISSSIGIRFIRPILRFASDKTHPSFECLSPEMETRRLCGVTLVSNSYYPPFDTANRPCAPSDEPMAMPDSRTSGFPGPKSGAYSVGGVLFLCKHRNWLTFCIEWEA